MKNTITEIKNTLEGIHSRKMIQKIDRVEKITTLEQEKE